MSLFALEVGNKAVGVDEPLTNVLHLSQVCLAEPHKNGKATVKLMQNGKPFTVCVLEGNKLPHAQLNHFCDPMETKFIVDGNAVHLSGYYELPGPDENVDDLEGDEEDLSTEDGEEDLALAQQNMNKQLKELEKKSNLVPDMTVEEEEEEEEVSEDEEMDAEEEQGSKKSAPVQQNKSKDSAESSEKPSVSKPAIEEVTLKEGDDEESDLAEMDDDMLEEEEEEEVPELTDVELKEIEASFKRQGVFGEADEEEEEEGDALDDAEIAALLDGEEEEEEEVSDEDEAPPAKKAKRG